MADRYLLETSAVDGYLLEDGSGVLLLETGFATLYPAVSQLSDCYRNVRVQSLAAGDAQIFPGGFTPVLLRWNLPYDRMGPGPAYIPDTNPDHAWIRSSAFDPSPQTWTIDSQRVPSPRPRPDTNSDTAWMGSNNQLAWTIDSQRITSPHSRCDTNLDTTWLAAILAFDPAQYNWTIDSQVVSSRSYWSALPPDLGWLVPAALFDGALWSGIHIDSYRLWPHAVGRWQPDLDQAWLYTSQPVVVFDPALYAAIAQIYGERTASQMALAVQLQGSLYDLSWVHDVIPLTDPAPGTAARPRPIAPIMSARRRNKKRR